MSFVTKRDDIVANIVILENYLVSKKTEEKKFALDLVASEELIVVYKVDGINHFSPARFTIVKGTDRESFEKADRFTAGEVTNVLNKIVGAVFYNETTDSKYLEYTETLGLSLKRGKKGFWRIKDERGKNLDLKSANISL